MLLSRMAGGLTLFNLSDTALPISAMNRPGPVTDLKFSAGRLFTAGELNPVDAFSFEAGETPVAELALLKVQATRCMEFCAREASQILGGASYMRGERIERIYREVRVNAIGGGSEEIMLDLAARQLRI